MIGSADLHKSVVAVWNTHGLEGEFKKLWDNQVTDRADFVALYDQEAPASQPFPYCVFEQDPGDTTVRMSGHNKNENHEIREIPWQFRVHAKALPGSSAKQIAAGLAEHIIIRYGGDPNSKPKEMTLDNGNVILAQYRTDYPIREGDEEFQWVVSYIFSVDVPVAT